MERAVEPAAQVKSDLDIFTALASRLSIEGYNEKTEEEWLQKFVSSTPGFPDYHQFKEKKVHYHEVQRPWVAFQKEIEDPANHPFRTPSGKIEIYSQKIAQMKNPLIPPIPEYLESWEGPGIPCNRLSLPNGKSSFQGQGQLLAGQHSPSQGHGR